MIRMKSLFLGAFLGMAALLLTSVEARAALIISTFSGGDSGEGLDFTEPGYVYAVDSGGPGGMSIQGLAFTDDTTTPGVTPVGGTFPHSAFVTLNYGASTNDDNLETLMNTTRFGGTNKPEATVAVLSGRSYVLEVLMTQGSNFGDNNYEFLFNGVVQGSAFTVLGSDTVGTLLTYDFVAPSTSVTFKLDLPSGGGGFVFMDAFALRLLPVPEPTSASLLLIGAACFLGNRQRRKLRGNRVAR